jgi:hypothetical protein
VARKNRSILDELVRFPWWASVILAGVVYAGQFAEGARLEAEIRKNLARLDCEL